MNENSSNQGTIQFWLNIVPLDLMLEAFELLVGTRFSFLIRISFGLGGGGSFKVRPTHRSKMIH